MTLQTALARKYRPAALEELLGQEPLVRMMRAAIEHGRVAQAYILTGVRGVGKTTTARIMARSLNCKEGPTLTPCGECSSCQEIAADSSLDVIELDAASRNGVGDMRELLESVAYAPMTPGAKKIYIIDEAHMLSTQAWNALLKTLEEPPSHVLFIFATTEPQKIPATIQSRCQRFSLRRIPAAVIAENIQRIADSEKVQIEDGVALAIARAGEGSMRDAISILDQAIGGAEQGQVHLEEVLHLLGRGSRPELIRLLEASFKGDAADAISRWRESLAAGAEPLTALDDLGEILHLASLAKIDPGLLADLAVSEADNAAIVNLAAALGFGPINSAERLIVENRAMVTNHPNQSQAAEILIMRLAVGFRRIREAKAA